MRWDVKGLDKESGADRFISVEAEDEKSAVASASRAGMYIESCKSAGAPAPVITYEPPPAPTRRRSRFLRRNVLVIEGIVATIAIVASVWVGFRTEGGSTNGRAAVGPAASILHRGTGISYASIAGGVGKELVLTEEKTMDGRGRFIGTSVDHSVTILLTGDRDDLDYAHIAVIFYPREFRALNSGDASSLLATTTLARFGAMGMFLDAVAPDWPGRTRWLEHELSQSEFAERSTAMKRGKSTILYHWDPTISMVKLAVEPS